MTIINGIKYSCASCVKGHRASSCQHTDRPQIEIKRKGRPVTQCTHCREVRKTKKLRVKCICAEMSLLGYENRTYRGPLVHSNLQNGHLDNIINSSDYTKNRHCRCCKTNCETPSTKYCDPKKPQVIKFSSTTFITDKKFLGIPKTTEANHHTVIRHSSLDTRPKLNSNVSYSLNYYRIPSTNTDQFANKRTFSDTDIPNYDSTSKRGSYSACGSCDNDFPKPSSRLTLKDLLNPCDGCHNRKNCSCSSPVSNPSYKKITFRTTKSSDYCY